MGLNVKRRENLIPHCETIYRNFNCPYIELGCTGCMIKINHPFFKINLTKIKRIYDKFLNDAIEAKVKQLKTKEN